VSRKLKQSRDTVKGLSEPQPEPGSVIPPDTEPPVPQGVSKNKEPEEEKDYSSILAQLRANRKSAPGPTDEASSKTRKRRQLGRATSTRSNVSAGESSGDILADDDNENTVVIEEYQPSQTLGWESPGAAKAREQMIRKLGGTVQEKSVAVEEIGVVRDVGGEELMGRAGRKRRG
jgi:DNA replication regulator DPB11